MAPLEGEETDPGQWWVPEVVGRRPQRVDPPCRSGMAQGTRSSGARQGRCCTKNPERMNGWDETLEDPGLQKWNKEPRLKTGATSGKCEDIVCGPRANSRAADREANSRVFCQDSKNE
jgi:hypothetical protein